MLDHRLFLPKVIRPLPILLADWVNLHLKEMRLTGIWEGLDIVSDSLHANINNPASLGDLKLVTYSLGLNYKTTKLSSSATNESVTSASIDYLVVAIPTKKFTFSFGILTRYFCRLSFTIQLLKARISIMSLTKTKVPED